MNGYSLIASFPAYCDARHHCATRKGTLMNSNRIETTVAIVGAGPVGLTLALDWAWRGVNVTIIEARPAEVEPSVKCGQISARSMEIFRRLGIADELRSLGLPADYPNDIVSATSVTGLEVSRVPIPARGRRGAAVEGPDTTWPTPEHTHRVNQTFFEPVLFDHVAAHPRVQIFSYTELERFSQDGDGVTVIARVVSRGGKRMSVRCRYLVGCDGARSTVREAIGATYVGTSVVQRVQSSYIHAPALLDMLPGKPAWNYFSLNPRRCGSTMAVDGRKKWLIHNYLYRGEADFDAIDRDWAIRTILGVGPDFHYDLISKEDWIGRRLVADKFRDRRVFICGDAAHIWIPHGGYGMNAGIADAADLAWMLAGSLKGWASPAILDAYEAERRPITEQASQLITNVAHKVMKVRQDITDDIERPDEIGETTRARVGKSAYELDKYQQCCGGLNFGYSYDASPIVAYDDEAHPAYTMHDFASSTVPGCRLPHFWLEGGRSLYDALGPDYTLIRCDPTKPVSEIVGAAGKRGVPLRLLDVDNSVRPPSYEHALLLVRPDQHVAWRGNREPPNSIDLIDTVRGARVN